MKRLLMIAAAVAVLGLATVAIGGTITSAQEGDGPFGSILAKVADKLGVSEEELQTAFDEARDETIDEKVAEGLITEEQAERLRERGFPFAGGRKGQGCGQVKDAAAEVLGMTRKELKDELKDGNSLAEVAEAQGMSVEDFEAALLDRVQAQLGELVADGDLTQEQADDIFQRIEENIDSILSGEGRQHRRPGGFGGLGQRMPEGVESSEVTA